MVQVIEVPPSTPVVRDTPAAAALADPAVLEYRPPEPDTEQASVLSVVMTGAGGGSGGGGLPFSTRTVFADTVAVAGELLQVDATAATITITPPAQPSPGDYLTVAKIDDSEYSVVFSAPVSGDDEGAEIVAAHAAATFVWDGTTWLIVSVNTSYSGDAAVLAAIPEIARDTVGNTLVAGNNITLTPDDDADTITIAAQVPNIAGLASQAALDAAVAGVPEQARDALATALVAGAGISLSVNDTADSITITATAGSGGGSGSGVTTEDVQDVVATLLAAGTHSGISFTYNDTGDALSATVPAPSWSQITGRPAFAAVSVSGSASDLTTGTVDDARIPATITRDVELAVHTDNTANPHAVTKAQVGLGNVDNTADTAKPVSTATAAALAGKASTSHGHQASDIAASGIASSATFLRGDGAWAEPSVFTTGPPGGVQISGYSPTVAPNASAGTHFRYSASGTMTINPPINAEDGQKLLLEIQAVGGARTIGFSSSIEVSAAAPTRTTSIPSGQWGYFALLHRNGTWRLMAMDPVPT